MIVGCHLVFVPSATSVVGFLKGFTDVFVGIFGMIAGFLMCQYLIREEVGFMRFFIKRVKRILLPYLVWSVFFVGANCLFDALLHKKMTFNIGSGLAWLHIIAEGSAGTHTWFLIALFYGQIILFYPIRLLKIRPYGWMFLTCIGLVALSITVRCSGKETFWPRIGVYHVRLLAYLAFGAAFSFLYHKVQYYARLWPTRGHLAWFVWLVVACILFKTLTSVNGFWLAALVSFPIFSWAMIGDNIQEEKGTVIKQIASVSMGIYCIHPVFTALFHAVLTKMNLMMGDGLILADWVVCWALAWGCASLMSKNAFLKNLVT